jgi:tetratricopeptide (TPR) repeat protein
MLLRPACVCVAMVATVLTVSAQRPRVILDRGAAVERAVRWTTAVVRHAPGASDAELLEIAGFDGRALTGLPIELRAVRRLMEAPRTKYFTVPGTGPSSLPIQILYSDAELDLLRSAAGEAARAGLDRSDLVLRGLLLHADVALVAGAKGSRLQISDGQSLGVTSLPDHWQVASQLAAILERNEGRDPDLRLWYQATGAAMQADSFWHPGHADAAAARFGDDADLQFLAGALHESLASSYVQSARLRVNRFTSAISIPVGAPSTELRLAEGFLKRAVALNARHADAWIHYGRVLTLLQRPAEAVVALGRATREATEAEQRYYAALFLGRALEESNRIGESRNAYEQAKGLFPHAQAPVLALSHLAAQAGNPAEASSAIAALMPVGVPDDTRRDPWWGYHLSSGRNAARLMTQARAALAATHGGATEP